MVHNGTQHNMILLECDWFYYQSVIEFFRVSQSNYIKKQKGKYVRIRNQNEKPVKERVL